MLLELVHERWGCFMTTGAAIMLADRLAPLVVERGLRSFMDYYYLLKYDDATADGVARVLDALSVPETYFWREIDQIRAVVAGSCRELAAGGRARRSGSGARPAPPAKNR